MFAMHKKINNIVPKYNIIKTKLPLDIEVFDTSYISNKILSKISWKYDTWVISYDNKVQIIIHSNSKISKKIFKIMVKVKKFLKNDKVLYVNLFLTDEIKKLDYSKNEIGPNEVNSGCTIHFTNNSNGKIFIWRKEEMDKVLIHEMLHSLKVDYGNPHNVKSEGHIEAMATLIKIMLKNKKHKDVVTDMGKQNKHFKKQMDKISNYVNNNTKITTHVQEYYYDKAHVLKDLGKFVKYLNNNNYKYNETEYNELLKGNTIIETSRGNVIRNVIGNVRRNVRGNVRRNVIGNVRRNVRGNVRRNVIINVKMNMML